MKCEKWTDEHDTSVGQRKNLSPWQELIRWPPEHRAGTLSTVLQELKESKVISLTIYMYVMGVLHTARIRTVKVIVSVVNE